MAKNIFPKKYLSPQQRLSESGLAAPYGINPLFDVCGDGDLMSLSFQGMSPFLDWIGWERTNEFMIRREFIGWVRPDGPSTRSVGYLSDPCGDPNGIEYGACNFTLEDFARLRRAGPVRDITKIGMNYCQSSPRYRLDGTPINDNREFDMRLATEVLLQDLGLMTVEGNAATSGQFSGLQQLIKTGYTNSSGIACGLMDSIVVNWNHNGMDGGAGITWNGTAVSSTVEFIKVLLQVYRRIRTRISMAPTLATMGLTPGDMVLVLPNSFVQCVLDAYTCWSVCDGDAVSINSLEARNFRDKLNGGMFGAGRIFLDGFEVPILPFDPGLIVSGATFDAYLLTGAAGNIKLIQGQYNDMAHVEDVRPNRFSTDSGLILTWSEDDMTCEKQIVEMQPRLMVWTPWAQARFQNILCTVEDGAFSSDPWSDYFPYP